MLKFYTTSLRSKILLGFTIILLIMFFAALWSVYNFYLLNESIKSTMQQNYASITAADNMAKSLDEQLQAFIIIFNQDYERGDLLFTRSRDDFFYWYEKSREAVATNEEKDILDSLNTGYNNFITSVGDIIDYRVYERSSDLTKFNFFIIADQIKNLKRHSNRILEINHDILNETASNVKEITQTATIFMVVILLGAIVVSVLFSTQFSDYVVQPLKNLRKSVEHIAEGHFDERIEIDENSDEIITLAEEFNKMSERLQKYEQLNLSKILFEKKKSELTIESMNEPVLMVDENYNVLLANKTFNEVFGEEYRDKERIEKLLGTKIIQGDGSDKEIKNVYAAQDTITLRNSSGSQLLFKVIAASLELPETGTKGTVIVFNDITKYQELDKMKSEFIAKVSHELKTPLTSLGMALGIIEDGVVGRLTSKQKELVFSMKEDYERLNKLVYEILELTKLEANTDKIKFEKTETHKLAEYISKKFGILTTEKNIGLKIIDNSEGAFINCSFDHMVSAIENLLSNSLRFTPTNGEISYVQSVLDGNLLIEISDTGIGIGPDNLKKIFDKFIQIDDSAPGSLGLGLSIAKEIIEIHKGEIKAFSELGKGSTFQIKLPVA
jgi:signal transduction histidine kinase